MAFALHSLGIPLAPALLATFVYRLVTFWLPLLPALLLLPSIRELHARLPRVPYTDPDRDEGFPFRPGEEAAS